MLRRFVSAASKRWKTLLAIILLLGLMWGLIWAVLEWLIFPGYSLAWTGFGEFTKPNSEFIREKTLWDWMELFIVPIFLGVGVFLLNRSESKNEREVAADRQREAALQSYLDRMTDLLLKHELRETDNIEVRDIARIRTLTLLRGLDVKRAGIVLLFLHKAGLIRKGKTIVNLNGAHMEGVDLARADLKGANLADVNLARANLNGAYLAGANLTQTILKGADLSGAYLQDADLARADLSGSFLKHAYLEDAHLARTNLKNADLRGINLKGAQLEYVNLGGAKMRSAILESANLKGAKVSNKQLANVFSLAGATMPNGAKRD